MRAQWSQLAKRRRWRRTSQSGGDTLVPMKKKERCVLPTGLVLHDPRRKGRALWSCGVRGSERPLVSRDPKSSSTARRVGRLLHATHSEPFVGRKVHR